MDVSKVVESTFHLLNFPCHYRYTRDTMSTVFICCSVYLNTKGHVAYARYNGLKDTSKVSVYRGRTRQRPTVVVVEIGGHG